MGDFSEWFGQLPFFTKWWLALTVIFSVAGRFNLVNPYYLMLSYEPFINQFQIWRPITSLFFYPLSPRTGFHFLINLYFLYNYSLRLETGIYDGRPADYFFLLAFCWVCCVIVGLMAEIAFLMDPMVLSVLYIWCQLNKDVIVNFWFGTRFKAMYLPWVLLVFNLVISGGGLLELVGIVVGHIYYFLVYQYPQEFGGTAFLNTPSILRKWLPDRRTNVHRFGIPPQTRRPAADTGGGHNWGRGNVLGDN